MSKSPDAFRTISEVADWLGVQAHVLRFWESKFTQIKPVKRAGGRRYYRPADMLLLGGIRKLLHQDGLSIKEVQAILRDLGIGHVSQMSHDLEAEGPPKDANTAEQTTTSSSSLDNQAGILPTQGDATTPTEPSETLQVESAKAVATPEMTAPSASSDTPPKTAESAESQPDISQSVAQADSFSASADSDTGEPTQSADLESSLDEAVVHPAVESAPQPISTGPETATPEQQPAASSLAEPQAELPTDVAIDASVPAAPDQQAPAPSQAEPPAEMPTDIAVDTSFPAAPDQSAQNTVPGEQTSDIAPNTPAPADNDPPQQMYMELDQQAPGSDAPNLEAMPKTDTDETAKDTLVDLTVGEDVPTTAPQQEFPAAELQSAPSEAPQQVEIELAEPDTPSATLADAPAGFPQQPEMTAAELAGDGVTPEDEPIVGISAAEPDLTPSADVNEADHQALLDSIEAQTEPGIDDVASEEPVSLKAEAVPESNDLMSEASATPQNNSDPSLDPAGSSATIAEPAPALETIPEPIPEPTPAPIAEAEQMAEQDSKAPPSAETVLQPKVIEVADEDLASQESLAPGILALLARTETIAPQAQAEVANCAAQLRSLIA